MWPAATHCVVRMLTCARAPACGVARRARDTMKPCITTIQHAVAVVGCRLITCLTCLPRLLPSGSHRSSTQIVASQEAVHSVSFDAAAASPWRHCCVERTEKSAQVWGQVMDLSLMRAPREGICCVVATRRSGGQRRQRCLTGGLHARTHAHTPSFRTVKDAIDAPGDWTCCPNVIGDVVGTAVV